MEQRKKTSAEELQEAFDVLNNIDHYSMKEEYWSDDYELRRADRLERLGAPQRVVDNLRNPKPAVEVVAKFLSGIEYLGGWKEIEKGLKETAKRAPVGLILNLKALEKLLATPQEEGMYIKLVAWDFNWSLDEVTDETSKAHLQKLAAMMREALGELAPPRQES